MRHDTAIVMIWTGYRNETYVGVIGNDEIRGSGFFRDGKPFGTFELKLMTQPGSR